MDIHTELLVTAALNVLAHSLGMPGRAPSRLTMTSSEGVLYRWSNDVSHGAHRGGKGAVTIDAPLSVVASTTGDGAYGLRHDGGAAGVAKR